MTSDADQLDPWGRLKIGDIIYQSAVAVLRTIEENEEMLGLLDAHSGDGDHGRTIVFGLRAAVGEMAPTGPPGVRIIEAGRAFLDASGGAAGALYGSLIQAIGGALVAGQGTAAAVRAGVDRVKSLGKAEVGDKTMIDALEPFCDEFEGRLAAGASLGDAWAHAAATATAHATQTSTLVARRGRSSKLGERSRGCADAGAASASLALSALTPAFLEEGG